MRWFLLGTTARAGRTPLARVPCKEGAGDGAGKRQRHGGAVRELSVVGVRVELPSNQPIVLRGEAEGARSLPIWIGAVESTAFAYEQQRVKPARPLTHDLL